MSRVVITPQGGAQLVLDRRAPKPLVKSPVNGRRSQRSATSQQAQQTYANAREAESARVRQMSGDKTFHNGGKIKTLKSGNTTYYFNESGLLTKSVAKTEYYSKSLEKNLVTSLKKTTYNDNYKDVDSRSTTLKYAKNHGGWKKTKRQKVTYDNQIFEEDYSREESDASQKLKLRRGWKRDDDGNWTGPNDPGAYPAGEAVDKIPEGGETFGAIDPSYTYTPKPPRGPNVQSNRKVQLLSNAGWLKDEEKWVGPKDSGYGELPGSAQYAMDKIPKGGITFNATDSYFSTSFDIRQNADKFKSALQKINVGLGSAANYPGAVVPIVKQGFLNLERAYNENIYSFINNRQSKQKQNLLRNAGFIKKGRKWVGPADIGYSVLPGSAQAGVDKIPKGGITFSAYDTYVSTPFTTKKKPSPKVRTQSARKAKLLESAGFVQHKGKWYGEEDKGSKIIKDILTDDIPKSGSTFVAKGVYRRKSFQEWNVKQMFGLIGQEKERRRQLNQQKSQAIFGFIQSQQQQASSIGGALLTRARDNERLDSSSLPFVNTKIGRSFWQGGIELDRFGSELTTLQGQYAFYQTKWKPGAEWFGRVTGITKGLENISESQYQKSDAAFNSVISGTGTFLNTDVNGSNNSPKNNPANNNTDLSYYHKAKQGFDVYKNIVSGTYHATAGWTAGIFSDAVSRPDIAIATFVGGGLALKGLGVVGGYTIGKVAPKLAAHAATKYIGPTVLVGTLGGLHVMDALSQPTTARRLSVGVGGVGSAAVGYALYKGGPRYGKFEYPTATGKAVGARGIYLKLGSREFPLIGGSKKGILLGTRELGFKSPVITGSLSKIKPSFQNPIVAKERYINLDSFEYKAKAGYDLFKTRASTFRHETTQSAYKFGRTVSEPFRVAGATVVSPVKSAYRSTKYAFGSTKLKYDFAKYNVKSSILDFSTNFKTDAINFGRSTRRELRPVGDIFSKPVKSAYRSTKYAFGSTKLNIDLATYDTKLFLKEFAQPIKTDVINLGRGARKELRPVADIVTYPARKAYDKLPFTVRSPIKDIGFSFKPTGQVKVLQSPLELRTPNIGLDEAEFGKFKVGTDYPFTYKEYQTKIFRSGVEPFVDPIELRRFDLTLGLSKRTEFTASTFVRNKLTRDVKYVEKDLIDPFIDFAARKRGHLVYGSFPSEAMMKKGKGRTPADIDVSFDVPESEIPEIAQDLLKVFKEKKPQFEYFIDESKPSLIQTKRGADTHHAIDIHATGGGPGSDLGSLDRVYGLKLAQQPIRLEGVNVMPLSEQAIRKGPHSILAPREYRIVSTDELSTALFTEKYSKFQGLTKKQIDSGFEFHHTDYLANTGKVLSKQKHKLWHDLDEGRIPLTNKMKSFYNKYAVTESRKRTKPLSDVLTVDNLEQTAFIEGKGFAPEKHRLKDVYDFINVQEFGLAPSIKKPKVRAKQFKELEELKSTYPKQIFEAYGDSPVRVPITSTRPASNFQNKIIKSVSLSGTLLGTSVPGFSHSRPVKRTPITATRSPYIRSKPANNIISSLNIKPISLKTRKSPSLYSKARSPYSSSKAVMKSLSSSPSRSPSRSLSPSISPYLSGSPSPRPSKSPSLSPSLYPSPYPSPSSSPSPSPSPSPSLSPSPAYPSKTTERIIIPPFDLKLDVEKKSGRKKKQKRLFQYDYSLGAVAGTKIVKRKKKDKYLTGLEVRGVI